MPQAARRHGRTRRLRCPEGRPSSAKRGYGRSWQRARLAFLVANPLCVTCLAEGRVTSASVVDHVKPHRGDEGRFWDEGNWQSLCERHHNAKSARERR